MGSASRTWFSRIFAVSPGIDPYATAASDVYQDLFGEGSFTGKGIYDLEAFERALDDLVRGEVRFPAGMVGDFVLLRSSGLPTYNFACVVDDSGMRISHVIRAEEHLSNTPRQLMLYRALSEAPPRFAHVPLILNRDRTKMSKRSGEVAVSVGDWRRAGFVPEALLSYLARTEGLPDPQRLLHVPLRYGRSAHVTVAVAEHLDGVDEGLDEAVSTYTRARVLLGETSSQRVAALLGQAPDSSPPRSAPPGRGYARLGDGPVTRLQVPHTPDPRDDTATEEQRLAVESLLPDPEGVSRLCPRATSAG